ncbi:Tetratricopeptide repeat superfamily protein [Perilla frutescens var. hirtella]|uniref:Tetratricopeptide repeat superfamily protein n=1 Tax=Perilla frutescens var. hirtella TaxID=608512 RepID=A0AAD4IXL8_PERFH|nr:Tetratricopeptide repeat superfamily protein [Perilla frutescens var. hirtella]KAH6808101.1 Tetratricopeptide repeat superfamily protein [Perilla frutescens var. frutescens]KAH6823442.1 Tetratricopeptide repeat superfamily protein [Perilla frutescens var. hirtella]
MDRDVIIQLGILIFTLAIFFILQTLPKRAFTKLRSRARPNNQTHRHFIQGAHLLARARSTKTKSASFNLAKSAVDEADKALALDPRDPAAHILKAMAETLMGRTTAALKSLDLALSPPAVKMLSEREKGDALVKRAELLIGLNRKRRVDSAIGDLVEAVGLSPDNARAFCLLGHCYEIKELREEARNAFEKALKMEPGLKEAHEGLGRLSS